MTRHPLLVASNNPHKIAELTALLADLPVRLLRPADLGLALAVEETGPTYAHNALAKARAGASQSGLLCLADDSGLEVMALGGRPGVHSARYGGPGRSDAERVALLLQELACTGDPDRRARFVCVLALATPDGESHLGIGTVEGLTADQPRGAHGFGYDPVFLLPDLGRTLAELPPSEKNRWSHRARAVQALRPLLRLILAGTPPASAR